MNRLIRFSIPILGLAFFVSCPASAGEPDSGKESLILYDKEPSLLKPTLDTRIRYEYGNQDGLEDSHAGTIRNRLGVLTREINGLQGFVEYEGTHTVDRQSYRAASVHGPANKTIIADPESNELNQAWISYTTSDGSLSVKAGRQGINLDNQRYVGTVAWRQNMQTLDAAGVTWNLTDDVEIYYGYIWQVNRIFGSDVFAPVHTDFKGQSHLVNAKFKNLPMGTLTTYVYSFDLHNVAGDANSNTSFGATLAGSLFDTGLDYYAEFAHQIDAYSNPRDYNNNYAHAALSGNVTESIKGTVGIEYLGADNGVGYNFPLGTNHKFNGFADRFLNTPPVGLTDFYVSLATQLKCGAKVAGFYHYFNDDGFDRGLGQEVDLVVSKDLGRGFSILGKGAYFLGQNGVPDTTRASIEIDFKY